MNLRKEWIDECQLREADAPTWGDVVRHNWNWFSDDGNSYGHSVGWFGPRSGYLTYVHPKEIKAKYAKGFKPCTKSPR